jgi:hypothetical protein
MCQSVVLTIQSIDFQQRVPALSARSESSPRERTAEEVKEPCAGHAEPTLTTHRRSGTPDRLQAPPRPHRPPPPLRPLGSPPIMGVETAAGFNGPFPAVFSVIRARKPAHAGALPRPNHTVREEVARSRAPLHIEAASTQLRCLIHAMPERHQRHTDPALTSHQCRHQCRHPSRSPRSNPRAPNIATRVHPAPSLPSLEQRATQTASGARLSTGLGCVFPARTSAGTRKIHRPFLRVKHLV